GGELAQRGRLGGAVDDLADHPAGELAVDDLEGVGPHEVQFQIVRQRLDDLAETAGHYAALEADTAKRTDGGARAGGQLAAFGDLVDHRLVEALQRRHPLPQRFGEVDLPAHGRL